MDYVLFYINFKRAVSKYNEVYALIIDGFTLGHLFSSGLQEPFRDLCMRCSAVLCCRMTPAQKAEVRFTFCLLLSN